jgi:hypothetical protein
MADRKSIHYWQLVPQDFEEKWIGDDVNMGRQNPAHSILHENRGNTYLGKVPRSLSPGTGS